jgi:hypothetical protein
MLLKIVALKTSAAAGVTDDTNAKAAVAVNIPAINEAFFILKSRSFNFKYSLFQPKDDVVSISRVVNI